MQHLERALVWVGATAIALVSATVVLYSTFETKADSDKKEVSLIKQMDRVESKMDQLRSKVDDMDKFLRNPSDSDN